MYVLGPDIRACVDSGAIIFLDLRADRYLSIDEARAPAIGGVCGAGTGELADALKRRGLILADAPDQDEGAVVPSPAARLRRADLDFHAGAWLHMLLACVRADNVIRGKRLDLAFARLARLKSQARRPRGRAS